MAASLKFGNGNWATKEGSALAYSDKNGNFKPLPFDFTRASDATVVNKQGLIETVGDGIPRIDFADSENGALKLEPQSTNHTANSEQPSTWHSSNNVTITANATASPDGTQNASTLVNTSTSNCYVRNNFNYSVSGTTINVTTSVFIKYTNNQWVFLQPLLFSNGGTNGRTWFDIQNGVVGTDNSISSSIQDFGNGWYRCSITHTVASADPNGFVYFYAVDGDNSATQEVGKGFSAFGCQGEQLSYATSYIPTSGTTVTRVGETCVNATPEINSEEGVLYAEVAAFANDTSGSKLIGLSANNANYVVLEFKYGTIKTALRFNDVQINNTTSVSTTNGNYNKIAISWNNSTKKFKTYVNGVLDADLTFVQNPSNLLNNLSFDKGNGTLDFFGKTKALAVWKEALSDEELTKLTTI